MILIVWCLSFYARQVTASLVCQVSSQIDASHMDASHMDASHMDASHMDASQLDLFCFSTIYIAIYLIYLYNCCIDY